MDKLQKYEPSSLSRLDRLKHALRSYWMGPISASDPRAREFFGGSPTSTGVAVDEFTALNYSAVFAAVGLISSQVGNLPLLLYRKVGDGKERFDRHPLYRLIHDRPNPDMSAFVFRETLQAHILTWGNGYAEIVRDGAGRPSAFWPITPDRVTPFRRSSDAPLEYRVVDRGGDEVFITQGDMLHVPGHGFNGISGYSVIAKMRESIGLGLAAERFGGTFFGNGATFGGVISYPNARPPELAEKNYRDTLNSQHQGVNNSHKFLALYNGATYSRLGIPPNDAQFLETRQFQIAEIARWFNLPPHKLKELSRSTNNNIEHQNLEYYIDCLAPWLERWEQELSEKLISPLERTQQTIEFVADGLLRGDSASRGEFNSKQFSVAMLTPNEGRKLENRNPLSGGDTAFVPLNMIPLHLVEAWTQAEIDSKKADAEAKRRQPPTAGPSAEDQQQQKQREDQLESELAQARRLAQNAEDAKDLAVHGRDQIAADLATSTTAYTALVEARATDRTDFTTQIETLRSDLLTAQTLRDQTLAAKDAAEAARSASAVDLARVQLLLETEQRDRDTERTEAARAMDDRHAELAIVQQAREDADRVTAETRQALDQMTADRETALHLVTERTAEREALAQQVTTLSTQIESLSLDVTVAQRDRDAATEQAEQTREALDQMTAQATALGTDLLTAQRDLTAAVAQAAVIEADYQRMCAEKVALETRIAEGEAALSTLRAEVVSLSDEVASLTTAVVDTRQALSVAETKQADLTRQLADATADGGRRATAVNSLQKRVTDTQMAVRGVLIDAVQRGLVTRETDRARKHQTPEKLAKWVEVFYPMHEDVCRTIMRPAVKAWLVASGIDEPVDRLLDRVIPSYIGESTRTLRGLLAETDGESLPPALERVCRRWETDRAEAFADRIMKEADSYGP